MADKDYVKGKFSKYETDIVLEMVTDYMEKKNVSIEEMCSAYRTTSKRQNHPFFKEIYSMLPHRSPKVFRYISGNSLWKPKLVITAILYTMTEFSRFTIWSIGAFQIQCEMVVYLLLKKRSNCGRWWVLNSCSIQWSDEIFIVTFSRLLASIF